MAVSTTRSNTTCFQDYPRTSCEKHSRSSGTTVELTPSLTTRPACASPTRRSSNTCMRSVRHCAKQERRGDLYADQEHIEYEWIDSRTGRPLQESELHRVARRSIPSHRRETCYLPCMVGCTSSRPFSIPVGNSTLCA